MELGEEDLENFGSGIRFTPLHPLTAVCIDQYPVTVRDGIYDRQAPTPILSLSPGDHQTRCSWMCTLNSIQGLC